MSGTELKAYIRLYNILKIDFNLSEKSALKLLEKLRVMQENKETHDAMDFLNELESKGNEN